MTTAAVNAPGFPTFLFTDIVGSTQAARRIPYRDYRGELLDPQFATFSKLITEHNGQECGTPAGDSVLAAFPDVQDALRCAVAMQQAMPTIRHTDREGTVTTLAARIGLHTSGEIVAPDANGLFTNHPEVIHAARIMAIANGGQILLSNRSHTAAGVLPWEQRCWRSRRIKDWEEAPEDIYELLHDSDTSRPEPGYLYAPDWFREFNRYVPRPELESEVLGLFEKLPNGTFNRLVTLHGFGGMGKTRLAVQCCLLAAGAFSGNLRLVRLEAVGDTILPDDPARADFLAGHIAEAFAEVDREGLTPANLPDRLPDPKCLLLLDNFETVHCPEALKLVYAMLNQRPALHILITSREAVKISNIGRVKEIVGMERDAAQSLLMARIELKRPGWQPSLQDRNAMERLLDLTAGIPLALELVAAHVDEYTLTEIADGLGSNVLGEMTGPAEGEFNVDESGRHHSLENCFFWSWKLLSPEAQQALIRLSLFASRCSAAEITACFSSVQQKHLTALMNASLAIRQEADGASVYDVLNPTRAFARSRLLDQDSDMAIRRQFVAYYRNFVEENGGQDNVEDTGKRGRLERSWQHVVAAAEIAAELGDVESCGNIADAAFSFFDRQALWSAVLSQGRYSSVETLLQEALQMRKSALPQGHPGIVVSLNNLAHLYSTQGRPARAEPLYLEALRILRTILPPGDPIIAICLNNLAALYDTQGRYQEAETLYKEALEIRLNSLPKEHPDVATSLNNLGAVYRNLGRYDEAEPLYREALRIFQLALPQGHPHLATSLSNLAGILQNQGRHAEAEALYREALAIWQSSLPSGHPGIVPPLSGLALVYRTQGRYAEAEPLLAQALQIRRASLPPGHPRVATSLNNLAEMYLDQGRWSEAEPLFREALQIRQAALPPGHTDLAQSLGNLASLLAKQGRPSEAEPLYRQAIDIWLRAVGAKHPHLVRALTAYQQMMTEQASAVAFAAFLAARPDLQETLSIVQAPLEAA